MQQENINKQNRKVFVINESQAALLLEARPAEEIRSKYYPDIDQATFQKIVDSDPTSRNGLCGKYVKWIANLYKNGKWKEGDAPETKTALTILTKHGTKLPQDKRDVNRYTSVGELYDAVKGFESTDTQSEAERKSKEGAEKVYEDSDWTVVIPHTEEAAKLYGANARWCTAAENNNMFDYYNNQGPLYIIMAKHSNAKWQFHFPTGQFMDSRDIQIPSVSQLEMYGDTEKLFNWLETIDKKLTLFPNRKIKKVAAALSNGTAWDNEMFDDVIQAGEDILMVSINGKYNFVDNDDRLMCSSWLESAAKFSEGLARVSYGDDYESSEYKEGTIAEDKYSDGEYVNYMDAEGNFIVDDSVYHLTWGEDFGDTMDRYAIVELYNDDGDIVKNLLCHEGYPVIPGRYEFAEYFGKDIIIIKMDDKRNLWSLSKGLLYGDDEDTDKWPDRIDGNVENPIFVFREYKGRVAKDRFYVMDKNLRPINKIPFDYAKVQFGVGLISASVYLKDGSIRGTFIKPDGTPIYGEADKPYTWFNATYSFVDNLARVKVGKKWNFINPEGKFLSKTGFDEIRSNFYCGYAAVGIGFKDYFIDSEANIVSPDFDWIDKGDYWFHDQNRVLARVRKDNLDYWWNIEESKPLTTYGVRELSTFTYYYRGQWSYCVLQDGKTKGCMNLNGDIYDNETPNRVLLVPKDGKPDKNETYARMKNTINEELTEVEPKEVNMRSFEVKDGLCGKLWDDNSLDSQVRLRLLDIADDFIEELNIKWVKPKDILFTGSLANYNWSEYSDIDVHVVYDYSEIYSKKEFVEEYFKSKKNLWNNKHEDLEIYGYPVEMGVEDSESPLPSSGVYSLNKGEWIRKPEPMSYDEIDEPYVRREAARIMTAVDDIEPLFNEEEDTHKKGLLASKVKRILSDLKEKRKKGLKRGGEMNSDNIIYKLLRRGGYLDRMRDIVDRGYDAENSITEMRNLNEEISEYATDRFNTDEFAGLPFTKKVQYCKERLGKPIGNGSSRMVFDAGNGKVLKLAKNSKGLAQNLVEIQNSNDCYYGYMYPEVFEADDEKGTYIIAEFAENAKKSQFKQRTGVTYDEFVHFCRGFESEYEKRSWMSVDLTQEEYDVVEQNGTLNTWYYYITDMQPYNVGEIIALRNLGFVRRNGEYDLVIVDSGFNEEVAMKYYKRG